MFVPQTLLFLKTVSLLIDTDTLERRPHTSQSIRYVFWQRKVFFFRLNIPLLAYSLTRWKERLNLSSNRFVSKLSQYRFTYSFLCLLPRLFLYLQFNRNKTNRKKKLKQFEQGLTVQRGKGFRRKKMVHTENVISLVFLHTSMKTSIKY